jgi:hypothetical protein
MTVQMRDCRVFRHPQLVHGVVHTPWGNFEVRRGCVRVPSDVGIALGWSEIPERDDDRRSHGFSQDPDILRTADR